MMIGSNNAVPLPSAMDDELLGDTERRHQASSTSSQMSSFVYSCRLFEILHDILVVFYVNEEGPTHQQPLVLSGTEVDECLTNVLKFNKRIDNLLAEAPDELSVRAGQVTLPEARHNTLYLQQQVVYCRYVLKIVSPRRLTHSHPDRTLYVRLLSLRPLLLQSARGGLAFQKSARPTQPALTTGFIRECCLSCVKTAYTLIDAVYENLTTPYGSPAWHAVYCMTLPLILTHLSS